MEGVVGEGVREWFIVVVGEVDAGEVLSEVVEGFGDGDLVVIVILIHY